MATKRKLEKARARRRDFVKRHNTLMNLPPLEKAQKIMAGNWQPKSKKLT